MVIDNHELIRPPDKESPSGPRRINELENALSQIREFFLQHETDKSKQAIALLKDFQDLCRKTDPDASLWIGGSIGFGQAVDQTNDIDFIYVGHTPTAWRDDVLPQFYSMLSKSNTGFSNLDWNVIDLDSAQSSFNEWESNDPDKMKDKLQIPKANASLKDCGRTRLDEAHLASFIGSYAILRKLDNKLSETFETLIAGTNEYMRMVLEQAGLEYAIPRSDKTMYLKSLRKYTDRLSNRGIQIPPTIYDLITKVAAI